MHLRCLLVLVFIGSLCFSQGDSLLQQKDSLISDTVKLHSPKKAGIYSAILPGLGQYYNRKLWYVKVPLIYGGLIGLGLSVDYNNKRYQFYRQQFISASNDPDFVTHNGYKVGQLKILRDNYESFRDQMFMYAIALYGMNILEAVVTAHLKDFDVSDDLTFKLYPMFRPREQVMGVGINLNF